MNTLVISAFPCTGKSYCFENQNKLGLSMLDSDSSNFSWIIDPIDSKKFRNPDFPKNYIKHIKDNIGKVDIIFVSSHSEVRQSLLDNNIEFICVYPSRCSKAEIVGRAYMRKSPIPFIDMLVEKWDSFFDEIEKVPYSVTFLDNSTTLFDKVKEFIN